MKHEEGGGVGVGFGFVLRVCVGVTNVDLGGHSETSGDDGPAGAGFVLRGRGDGAEGVKDGREGGCAVPWGQDNVPRWSRPQGLPGFADPSCAAKIPVGLWLMAVCCPDLAMVILRGRGSLNQSYPLEGMPGMQTTVARWLIDYDPDAT